MYSRNPKVVLRNGLVEAGTEENWVHRQTPQVTLLWELNDGAFYPTTPLPTLNSADIEDVSDSKCDITNTIEAFQKDIRRSVFLSLILIIITFQFIFSLQQQTTKPTFHFLTSINNFLLQTFQSSQKSQTWFHSPPSSSPSPASSQLSTLANAAASPSSVVPPPSSAATITPTSSPPSSTA